MLTASASAGYHVTGTALSFKLVIYHFGLSGCQLSANASPRRRIARVQARQGACGNKPRKIIDLFADQGHPAMRMDLSVGFNS